MNNLQKRSSTLKSELLHKQLKSGTYSFSNFKKYSLDILNQYKKHKSIYKASSITGIDYNVVMDWYVQGQSGNSLFRSFYLAINDLSYGEDKSCETGISKKSDEYYEFCEYEGVWTYNTFVDGEKISLISNDLDRLKDKIKSRNLPLD